MSSVPNTFSFLSLIKVETMQLCKSSCSINTVVLQNWCKPMSQKIRASLLDFQFSFIICAFLSIFESKSKISSVSSNSNFSKYWFSIPLFSRDFKDTVERVKNQTGILQLQANVAFIPLTNCWFLSQQKQQALRMLSKWSWRWNWGWQKILFHFSFSDGCVHSLTSYWDKWL